MILANFAVIEGGDGSGTTTQLALLKKRFENENGSGTPVFWADCEPTGGPVGLLIRRILKGEITVRKETLARLFAADRGEHLYGGGGIVERCNRGGLVVSDRYTPSSIVYQGLECGAELPEALNAAFPLPELLVYLDVEAETAMRRLEGRGGHDIFENAGFQALVRQAYQALLPRYRGAGVRVLALEGKMPPEELAGEIWRAVGEMPIMKTAK
ncbi:MAG: dTMP kinase [Treponema sp.]|jgi:dTMP kinase|nr:dTMP kinase [Treponema sp.]